MEAASGELLVGHGEAVGLIGCIGWGHREGAVTLTPRAAIIK